MASQKCVRFTFCQMNPKTIPNIVDVSLCTTYSVKEFIGVQLHPDKESQVAVASTKSEIKIFSNTLKSVLQRIQ